MTSLDKTDQDIIRILRQNAREPIKGIAAKTGLARSTVRHRIERMEANGIISGYRVELKNSGESGLEAFLLVKLKRTPSLPVVEVASGFAEVQRCYSLSGEIDLIIELQARNAERLNEVRDTIAGLEPVASVKTSVILNKNFEEG